MNESGSFVQDGMKSRAFCIDRVLVVCANRSGKIFYKVITSKATTKQYFALVSFSSLYFLLIFPDVSSLQYCFCGLVLPYIFSSHLIESLLLYEF